jgi:uncharacterized protein YeaO (DUF488 family)
MKEPSMSNVTTLMMMMERGEIIIADVAYEGTQGLMTLYSPAVVSYERPHPGALGFMLSPWIPTELIANSRIDIAHTMPRGSLAPSPELISFYKAWVATEQDRWKHFGKDFSQQIVDIEKQLTSQYNEAKFRRAAGKIHTSDHGHNELLIALFEEDAAWGNSSITH